MDFEGLGSSERTSQEDMLLSVFNASISILTIFKYESVLLTKITAFSFLVEQIGLIRMFKECSKDFNKESTKSKVSRKRCFFMYRKAFGGEKDFGVAAFFSHEI